MSSENEQRHTEVQKHLASTDDTRQQSSLGRYWSGAASTGLEREHAREEAAIEKRLERMRARPTGFVVARAS